MQIQKYVTKVSSVRVLIAGAVLLLMSIVYVGHAQAAANDTTHDGRLVTIYDRGQKRVILTHADTVAQALQSAKIAISTDDQVEPATNSQLVATDYTVNIYRARPVIVVDGAARQKIMTAAQTPEAITAAAGSQLRSEDTVVMAASQDIATDGASTVVTVSRAKPFTLKLYGVVTTSYSQAQTVGDMLLRKGIKLAKNDTVSVPVNTPLTAGMTVEVWREGVQTATVSEPIAFSVRTILDADHEVGYRAVQTPGVNGTKDVVYEITAKGGKEVSRKVIQSVTTEAPKEQVEIIGTKPSPASLTKSKGAQQFTDSKGIVHRETYYDLSMSSVMGACGGGNYTIRVDGAKIDKDGYILVAANLSRYPRCSIVETSMGPGKVYDTGGFAARYPDGFDLATDWTNYDGR